MQKGVGKNKYGVGEYGSKHGPIIPGKMLSSCRQNFVDIAGVF